MKTNNNNNNTSTYIPSDATVEALGADPKTRTAVQTLLVKAHSKQLARSIVEVVQADRDARAHKLGEDERFETEHHTELVKAAVRKAKRALEAAKESRSDRIKARLAERLEMAKEQRDLSARDKQLLGLVDVDPAAALEAALESMQVVCDASVSIPGALKE